jgi:Holliday junction resolvase RusA-like endonuclease
MGTPTISAKEWREQGGDIDPSELGDEVASASSDDAAKPVGRRRVQFTVPGRPVPLQRHRHSKNGSYLPTRSADYRELVQTYARMLPVRKFDGDVEVHCWFYFADRRHGDVDNYAKAILDALHGVAYDDDKCVATLGAHRFVERDCRERAVVEIRAIEGAS